MFRPLLLFLLLTTCAEFSYAQDKDNDLLVWEDLKAPDTLRLHALDALILKSIGRNADSAEVLSNMMIDFARKTGSKNYEGNGLLWLARVYNTQGRPMQSLDLLELCKKKALEAEDKQLLSETYNAFGIVYNSMSNYSLSIENYFKALKLNEELGKPFSIAKTYRNIGIGFVSINDLEKAEEYYLIGLEIVEREGLTDELPGYYNSLGGLNRQRGLADEAIGYFRRLIAMGNSVDNQKFIAASYHNLALTYWEEKKQLDSALVNFEMALKEKKRVGWASAFGSTYTGLGGVNSKMGRYDQALPWCLLSLEDARNKKSLATEFNACGCLYEAYKGLGKLDSALRYHELMEVMKDSLINVDREREINRKELGYTFEKKALSDSLAHQSEQAILVEQTEKQQIGLVAAGSGLLLLLILAYSIYSGKKKSDELLLNILPYETAQELKKKGYTDAKLIDDVTVLFTDFKGFTAMSEQLSPKELVADIHICFSEFDRIMEKYEIEKIKTIGDAYMAACGLPSPNGLHAQNVVQAAFEMRDFVETGKARKIEKGLPYFEIRIGIHTGPVVAGIVGIKKFQYDIWGDTVNTASRMESSGEVGKVNISDSTYALVQNDFTCEYRGKVEAKGKGKIDMYFVEPNS